ncbi:hypothetical protein CSB93_5514 [Pseudomonas paraeruginosa]|uniref:Uncharacterized protein n=1 Tax=Pseudomonas paraeruginosa TaxID=2994495 RepID=A0A2R3INV3_9PSED|nr:hypothetical protein CSB93_5514 [Pseudomonas paraeruginosa]PTC35449.1 hypothetical protein CLJ1_4149 [Pseudomonas aeruginosa]
MRQTRWKQIVQQTSRGIDRSLLFRPQIFQGRKEYRVIGQCGSAQGDTRQEHTPAFHIIDSINAFTGNDSMPRHRVVLSTVRSDQL